VEVWGEFFLYLMVARTSSMCELVLAVIKIVLAALEVGPEFAFN
jgi:hypothetical protein